MAGNKLSPRQKMINMMYLVLTAMLALNVSSEVLEAFESLRVSLASTANTNGINNNTLAKNIIEAIEKEESGGTTKHTALRQVVTEISGETGQLIDYLDAIRTELEVIGEKNDLTGQIERKDEIIANSRFWLGNNDQANSGHGDGKARELRDRFEKYVGWANGLLKEHKPDAPTFKPLVLDPNADSNIVDPESKVKTWENYTFYETPVIADIARVEKYKGDIRAMETELLNLTKNMLGDYDFTVDSIFAFEAPSAEIVTAGMRYQTKLLVGISSSSVKPEFMGGGITMDPSGNTATMTMTANGGVIPNGASEGIQSYTAMIKVPKADGTFEELPIRGSFRVRRPEIQVRSKELQLLYKDCGNKVEVDAPSLGELYNPDFTRSTGGRVLTSSTSRKAITLVPTARQFKLSVYNKGNGQTIKLDELKYRVVKPPKPRVAMFDASGREYNGISNLNRKQSVTVKLIPDKEFAGALKADARYKAAKVKLMYKAGLGSAKVVKSYSGAKITKGVKVNLNQGPLKNAPPGTKIFIEVEGVQRVNFQGKSVNENMPRTSLVIPGVLK